MSVGWTKTKKPFVIQPKPRKRKTTGNYWYGKVDVKDDEILCNKCYGEGIVRRINLKTLKSSLQAFRCTKCLGEGKLNWLDNAMGGVRKRIE